MYFRHLLCVRIEKDQLALVHELLSNNSLFVGQLSKDKSFALGAHDWSSFTTDLQTVNYALYLTLDIEANILSRQYHSVQP